MVVGRETIRWRLGTVMNMVQETRRVKSLLLDVPGWAGHRPGQHVDVRLTAEDGYQTQRSYSVASSPDQHLLMLTIEQLEDGEVSPYLTDALQIGDQIELRGPIGGWFTWEASNGGPLQLVAGGSGIVPLMAMIRHRVAVESKVPIRLLYSARTEDDIIYRAELERLVAMTEGLQVTYTLTRAQPPGWNGYARRVDEAMIQETAWSVAERPLVFICGPTSLVESVATTFVKLGHDAARVKTERFGPTGGSS